MKFTMRLPGVGISLVMVIAMLTITDQTVIAETRISSPDKKGIDSPPPAQKPVRRRMASPLAPEYKISNDICVNCHSKTATDIEKDGGKHKTVIGCQDCHVGHPPMVRKIIPVCSQCHQGKPHFKSGVCSSCHTNPHNPLFITMGSNATDPCLTCHTPQIKKLRENKSKHTALYCSSCHDIHRRIPSCFQCHKPHVKGQTLSDCKKCHQAHMPTVVTYGDKIASSECAPCHTAAFAALTASSFKHKSLVCVTCHKDKHKMIPKCESCHGNKHQPEMKSKFPICTSCHGPAHDLYNFKGNGAPAAVPGKKPVKKKR